MKIVSEKDFKDFARKNFPDKALVYENTYAFIQAGNCLGAHLHYECNETSVFLHIEGPDWRPIRNYLNVNLNKKRLTPSHWYRDNCQWTIDNKIQTAQDMFQAFLDIRSIIEPVIEQFEGKEPQDYSHYTLDEAERLTTESKTPVKTQEEINLTLLADKEMVVLYDTKIANIQFVSAALCGGWMGTPVIPEVCQVKRNADEMTVQMHLYADNYCKGVQLLLKQNGDDICGKIEWAKGTKRRAERNERIEKILQSDWNDTSDADVANLDTNIPIGKKGYGVEKIIVEIEPQEEELKESAPQNKDVPSENDEVSLSTMTLDELFHKPLCIPDYQRIYCWEEENVRRLWQDILKLTDKKPYHMGAIILHEKGEHVEMNVVDGQQRLVTLSLILHLLDSDFKSPLFNQKFQSEKAAQYVAYNYFLINQYLHSYLLKYEETKREGKKLSLKNLILKQLTFSVLTLSGDNLDLAYTFFSNQNSKGLSLTDYNLLKAHHLRFIPNEEQSIEVASHWDALLSTQSSNVEENVARTLGLFLFRLRKWRRKQLWDEDKKYRVKAEFEAAPTMPQIPAFGEQFNYYESIQGGAHFFAYTEKFVHLYKKFKEEKVYQLLEEHLSYNSHWRYKDIIQTMLFAYYVKFGDQYIDMAFQYIEPLVSKHRYSTPRALHYRILQAAAETDIVMMIDQATSPTFFLAEAKLCCDNLPIYDDSQLSNIQKNYKLQIKNVLDKINMKNL